MHANRQESIPEPNWRLELKDLIREVVSEELSNYSHKCRFDMTDSEAQELGYWLKKLHDRSEKASTAVFLALITTLVAGTLGALWYGIKTLITLKGAP